MVGTVTNQPLSPSGPDGIVVAVVTSAGSEFVAAHSDVVCADSCPATSTVATEKK